MYLSSLIYIFLFLSISIYLYLSLSIASISIYLFLSLFSLFLLCPPTNQPTNLTSTFFHLYHGSKKNCIRKLLLEKERRETEWRTDCRSPTGFILKTEPSKIGKCLHPQFCVLITNNVYDQGTSFFFSASMCDRWIAVAWTPWKKEKNCKEDLQSDLQGFF